MVIDQLLNIKRDKYKLTVHYQKSNSSLKEKEKEEEKKQEEHPDEQMHEAQSIGSIQLEDTS